MHSRAGFRASCAMIVAVAGFSLMPAAYAQTQTPSAPSTAAPATISDQKLDAVAAASKDVAAVGDRYKQKLATSSGDEQKRIIGEADSAMVKAITAKGLTVEEYKSIIQVAQNDPVVRDKLIQRMR